jgi:hypothetical protein
VKSDGYILSLVNDNEEAIELLAKDAVSREGGGRGEGGGRE